MATSPEIQNIVSTAHLSCELDLYDIATRTYNVEYCPEKFNGLTIRLQNPKCTANIFNSGSVVCMGARTEENTRIALRRIARIIQKLGYSVKIRNFNITNLVASGDLNFRPNFTDFYRKNIQFVSYTPELFPGLTYRKDGITIIVFKSGKYIITNARNREEIRTAFEDFQREIRRL